MQKLAQRASAPEKRDWLSLAANNPWVIALLYLSLFAVAAWPILSVTVPPLVDYPNHLARAHILNAWDRIPELQENYVINWALHPNIALDVLMVFLVKIFPIYDAGRAIILITLLVVLGGTLSLHKVLHGRIGLWPVFAYLFLFNHALFWGFLNYLLTAGLALFAFSGWIYAREKPTALRLVLFSTISLILFFGHLFGLFVYGISVLGYEIWRTLQSKTDLKTFVSEWSVTSVQFVLPSLLFVHWIVQNRSLDKAITAYGTIETKLVALISPVYFGMPLIDLPTALFAGFVLIWCRGRRGLVFAPELKVPLLLMATAALIMPHVLSDVWLVDIRLPTVVACMLVAGVRFQESIAGAERKIVSLAVVVIVVRAVFIADTWQPIDRNFSEFRSAVSALEPGKSLMVVQDFDDVPKSVIPRYEAIYWHMGALAIIEHSMFFPHLFTGHTSVDVSPTRHLIDTPSGTPISREVLAESVDPEKTNYVLGQHLSRYIRVFWDGWPETYDYVLTIRFGNTENPFPNTLRILDSGSFFDLYQVDPDSSP